MNLIVLVPYDCEVIHSKVYTFEKTNNGWAVETEDSQESIQAYVDSMRSSNCELYDTDDFFVCNHCGKIIDKEECTGIENGDMICKSCVDSYYTYCEKCGNLCLIDDTKEVIIGEGVVEMWCHLCFQSHAILCDGCGNYVSYHSSEETSSGDYICPNCCYGGSYFRCDECGGLFHINEGVYGDSIDGYLCEDCANKRDIREYHDNPEIVKHYLPNEKQTGLLIGTEIETEYGNRKERIYITKKWGEDERIIYQMRDGSLDDDGIECITQPMSKRFFDKFDFEGWMKELSDVGARSHQTQNCGLHVHLSRKWFMVGGNQDTEDAIVGLSVLFFKNNENEIEQFARRKGNRYCNYFSGRISAAKERSIYDMEREKTFKKRIECLKHCNKSKLCNDRYDCVNTTNKDTIEFRVFKGTLNAKTYRATVEFCIRVVAYAKYCYVKKRKNPTWEEFLSFKKIPSVLDSYLAKRFGSEYNKH